MNINDYINRLYDNNLTLEEIIDAARKVKTQRDGETAANKQREVVKKARLNAVYAIRDYLKLVLTGEAFADFNFDKCADDLVDRFEEMENELVQLNDMATRLNAAFGEFNKTADKKDEKKAATTTSKQSAKSDDEAIADFLKVLGSAPKKRYNPFDF